MFVLLIAFEELHSDFISSISQAMRSSRVCLLSHLHQVIIARIAAQVFPNGFPHLDKAYTIVYTKTFKREQLFQTQLLTERGCTQPSCT